MDTSKYGVSEQHPALTPERAAECVSSSVVVSSTDSAIPAWRTRYP